MKRKWTVTLQKDSTMKEVAEMSSLSMLIRICAEVTQTYLSSMIVNVI